MTCSEAEALLVAYTKGELNIALLTQLENHLHSCMRCRWNLEAVKKTQAILNEAVGPDITQTVTQILNTAIEKNSSDVHIEPLGDDVSIKMRLDGVLHEMFRLPILKHAPLVAHLHTLGESDPYESRIPQFSKFTVTHVNQKYQIRTTFIPTVSGIRVTLHLVSTPDISTTTDLNKLGLSPDVINQVLELLHRPTGLLLIAGPSGSGKTTTAHACLQEIAHDEISIFSIEESVYQPIKGVSQLALSNRLGLDYPSALKAIYHADPDVIFIGDLPDKATITAALELALTGHLVLACINAPDATGAISRLMEIGVEPYSLAMGLLGVIAVKLIRYICPDCVSDMNPTTQQLDFLRQQGIELLPAALKAGTGCENCRHTGYKGRGQIAEVLAVNDTIARALAESQFTTELGSSAVNSNMATDGARKVVLGLTTPEEVIRMTSGRFTSN